MDGASKFVRGDAIAGIIIILVNVVGGLVLGYFQYHMPLPGRGEHLHPSRPSATGW